MISSLTNGGYVLLKGGTFKLRDRIDITNDGITLFLAEDSTLTFADDASPTGVEDDQGNIDHPLIYNNGHDNFSLYFAGDLDGNNTNISRGTTLICEDQVGGVITSRGGVVTDQGRMFLADCEEICLPFLRGTGSADGVMTVEGCINLYFGIVYGEDNKEVLDLNAYNEGIHVDAIIGDNSGANDNELLDLGESRNISVGSVISLNTSQGGIVLITSHQVDTYYTDKTAFGETRNISIGAVEGKAEGTAILLKAQDDNPLTHITLTNLDVESTGSHGLKGITQNCTEANLLDDWRIEGIIKTSGTGGSQAMPINPLSGVSKNHHYDVILHSENEIGANIGNISNVQGKITAIGCGYEGIRLKATDSSYTVEDIDLQVVCKDNNTSGDTKGGLYIYGDGTVQNCRISGAIAGNTDNEVYLGSAGTVQDIRFSARIGDAGVYKNGGTIKRIVRNGRGVNDGDPSAGGQWNGHGYEGLIVRDTTNANTYIYNNGTWSQIASA